MTTLVFGGTGFIGRRTVPRLVEAGERVVVMDINPATADYSAPRRQRPRPRWRRHQLRGRRQGGHGRPAGPHHQPRLHDRRRREHPALLLPAGPPRHGQLLRGRAPVRRQPRRLRQFLRRQRPPALLRRPRPHRGRPRLRQQHLRHEQALQRVPGGAVQSRVRHEHHRHPPANGDRLRQGARLHGPRTHGDAAPPRACRSASPRAA